MERNDSKFTMDLKRAISLVSMPDEWFNTPAKRELLEKARTFIKNDRDMQTIFRGKATDREKNEAFISKKRAFRLLTGQIELNSKENIEHGVIQDRTMPNEKFVNIRKNIEKEGKEHGLDYEILATDSLLSSKYHMSIGTLTVLDARDSIKRDKNSALTLTSRWLTPEEGGPRWASTLEQYLDYFTTIEERLSGLDRKELANLGISPEEHKENIATITAKLKKVESFKKDVKDYELIEKNVTPNQEHLPLSERRLTFYDINKREDEYYTSVKNVSRELGLNEGDLDKVADKLKEIQQLIRNKSSEKTAYSETKNKPSYKTPTEKHELELDD